MDAPLNIVAVRSLMPPRRFECDEVEAAFMRWLAPRPEEERIKAKRILRNSGVLTRRSCLTMEEIFSPCTLSESSARYRRNAVELGVQLLGETLESAGVAPRDVDILITTSCTGFMIPSVDAHMAEQLGMRSDLLRLPVTQMGCAAGASGLMYAAEMLRARPGGIAAIVNVELPTNTMQLGNFSMDNIVSSALFSDGLGCTIVRNGGEPGAARIDGWSTHQVSDSLDLIGYNLTSGGFLMNLDPTLPDVISKHFDAAVGSLLSPRGMTLGDLAHFVVHPGGVKILERIEAILARAGRDARLSRETMRDYGNMSSSTVIVILERLLASQSAPAPVPAPSPGTPAATPPAPGKALLMSFGPGFGAHQLLLTIGKDN